MIIRKKIVTFQSCGFLMRLVKICIKRVYLYRVICRHGVRWLICFDWSDFGGFWIELIWEISILSCYMAIFGDHINSKFVKTIVTSRGSYSWLWGGSESRFRNGFHDGFGFMLIFGIVYEGFRNYLRLLVCHVTILVPVLKTIEELRFMGYFNFCHMWTSWLLEDLFLVHIVLISIPCFEGEIVRVQSSPWN